MFLLVKDNFILAVKFSIFCFVLHCILIVESTEKESCINHGCPIDISLSKLRRKIPIRMIQGFRYHPYKKKNNDTKCLSVHKDHKASYQCRENKILPDKETYTLQDLLKIPCTIQMKEIETIKFDYFSNNKNNDITNTPTSLRLGIEKKICTPTEGNENYEFDIDDNVLSEIIEKTLDDDNNLMLEECIQGVLNWLDNDQAPLLIESAEEDSNTTYMEIQETKIEADNTSMDLVKENSSYSNFDLTKTFTITEENTQTYTDKNEKHKLEINNSILVNNAEGTLDNELITLLLEYFQEQVMKDNNAEICCSIKSNFDQDTFGLQIPESKGGKDEVSLQSLNKESFSYMMYLPEICENNESKPNENGENKDNQVKSTDEQKKDSTKNNILSQNVSFVEENITNCSMNSKDPAGNLPVVNTPLENDFQKNQILENLKEEEKTTMNHPQQIYSNCLLHKMETDANVKTSTNVHTHTGTNKETNKKKIEKHRNLVPLPEMYIIENTYVSEFKKMFKIIIYVNMIIKEINTLNIEEIKNIFDKIRSNYKYNMDHLRSFLCSKKKHSSNKSLQNLIIDIMDYNQSSTSSEEEKQNVMNLLDSKICMLLFLELVSNFAMEIFDNQKQTRQKFFTEKKKLFEHFPNSAEELTNDIYEIRSMLTKLTTRIDQKNKLYGLRGYYLITFLIQNIFDHQNEDKLYYPIIYLIDEFSQIRNKYSLLDYNVSIRSVIEITKILNEDNENDDISGNGERIQKLLIFIKEEQEKIKGELMENLKEQRMISLYILYHLSYLILRRCYTVKDKSKEFFSSFTIYKSFIHLWNSLFHDIMKSSEYNNLNETEQNIICQDYTSIHSILKYIFLNIIKIILNDLSTNHAKYVNILKEYKQKKENSIDRKFFIKKIEFYQRNMNKFQHLLEALKEINTHRSLLQQYIRYLSISNILNEHVNNMLFVIKSFKNKFLIDMVRATFSRKYNAVIPLFKAYIENEPEDL